MGPRQAAEKAEIGNSFCSPAANPLASALLPATDNRGRHVTRPGDGKTSGIAARSLVGKNSP